MFNSCDSVRECDQTIDLQYQSGLILADGMNEEEYSLNSLLYCQIAPEKTVIVQGAAHLPFMVNGVTYPLNETTYLIQLKDGGIRQERLWTLFHEWGHVYQFETRMLQSSPVRWMGVPTDFEERWSKRPWEQSADTLAYSLWNQYLPDETPPDYLVQRTLRHLDPKEAQVK